MPAAALLKERAAGDEQAQDVPVPNLDLAAPGHPQAEEESETTELVRYTSVFQVEKEKSEVVGDTTFYIDTAASSHMVDSQSLMSKYVFNLVDCAVRIIESCGTPDATKKGTDSQCSRHRCIGGAGCPVGSRPGSQYPFGRSVG